MASQSFNVIDQDEEQELVAIGTRQSRGSTPLSRPNSRMEGLLSHLVKIQEETAKSQAKANKSLEAKVSEVVKSQVDTNTHVHKLIQTHTSTDDKLSQIAYTQIEQIAEMSDLVDRLSTVERSLQGSPSTGSDPTRRSLAPPGHALMASAPYLLSSTTPSSLTLERSKTAQSSDSLPPTAVPLRRSLRLEMKRNPSYIGLIVGLSILR